MRALICGAGIAGCTAAWWLERAGWDVELVERAPAARDGGYMIDFFGPGYEVASRMGLLPRLNDVRYPIEAMIYRSRTGRATSQLTAASVKALFTEVLSLLRGDLARAIATDAGAPVRYGISVAAVDDHGDGIAVTLTDGTVREADLLIGADGTGSRVRDLVFGPAEAYVRSLGHHVASYTITDAGLSAEVGVRYQMISTPGRMAGAYGLRDDRLALLFLHRTTDRTLPADPAAALRDRYGDLGWIIPRALAACPPPERIYYDHVTQIEMTPWHRGRVVLLGDACQAVSLFAGHGASLAMAAAWILNDELSAAADLPTALARYEARMRPAVTATQSFGRRFLNWMAPDTLWRIAVRDLAIHLARLPGAGGFLRSATPGVDDLIPADSAR